MSSSNEQGPSSPSTTSAARTPEQVLREDIDPQIDEYEAFLRERDGVGLAPFEREMFRGFLYWRLRGPPTS